MTAPADRAPRAAPPLYNPVVLRAPAADDTAPVASPPPSFATVRPLDLADLRRLLKRRLARAARATGREPGQEEESVDARLYATLVEILRDKRAGPEVVVVEWPSQDGIRLETVRLGDTLMLGAHLSTSWADEALSAAARRALDGGLRAVLEQSGFRPLRAQLK